MRISRSVPVLLFALLSFVFVSTVVYAADYPKEPVPVKLEGAKMPTVNFPHAAHVEKQKLECVKCHHKDADSPKACTTCHGKEAQGKTPSAKDALHARCQGCHKEAAAKGMAAPTKCNECHKK